MTDGPTSRRFTSQRLDLHYLDWGDADAPPLILLHGGRDHARTWDWIARELLDRWHVLCPDLRGHGDSAWSSDGAYSMPRYVADLAEFIHREVKAPTSIVGHSLGGAVALRYAGLVPHDVRRLAVIEGLGTSPLDRRPAAPVAQRWTTWVEERRSIAGRRPRRYASLEAACERMALANPALSPDRVRHLTTHGTIRDADGTYGWRHDPYVISEPPTGITDDELHELWARVACPVWLVHGAESWARHPGLDGRAARFADARVTSFEGAGHLVHHDRHAEFVAGLRAFL